MMTKPKDTSVSGALALAVAAGCLLAPSDTFAASGMDAGVSNFSVQNGAVVPQERYLARFRVLGTELVAGGNDAPVAVQFKVGDQVHSPFGAINALSSDINDHQFPKDMETDEHASSGTAFSIEAQSWRPDGEGGVEPYLTVTTAANSANFMVLRNGDAVPDIPGMDGQDDISAVISDYVDQSTNTVRLYDDEVIFLFELGTTDLTSEAADFQDLVVLVTMADHPSRFHAGQIPALLIGD